MIEKIKKFFTRNKKAEEAAKEYVPDLSKLSPKEAATAKKEPYIAVLNTHINKDNIRNGFFELDWNDYFVLKLREAGYTGATDEEIVDAWFTDLCKDVAQQEGIDMSRRGSGYINRFLRDDGMTEVS